MTELTVVCEMADEWGKPTHQPHGLTPICCNHLQMADIMALQSVQSTGHRLKHVFSGMSRILDCLHLHSRNCSQQEATTGHRGAQHVERELWRHRDNRMCLTAQLVRTQGQQDVSHCTTGEDTGTAGCVLPAQLWSVSHSGPARTAPRWALAVPRCTARCCDGCLRCWVGSGHHSLHSGLLHSLHHSHLSPQVHESCCEVLASGTCAAPGSTNVAMMQRIDTKTQRGFILHTTVHFCIGGHCLMSLWCVDWRWLAEHPMLPLSTSRQLSYKMITLYLIWSSRMWHFAVG
jgi:hypothetical protein